MKKCSWFFLSLFFFSASNYCQQNFYWQNPHPNGNDYNSVVFLNSTTGFAATNGGIVLKTTDAGSTWSSTDLSTASGWVFQKIFFLNDQEGWIVGSVSTTGLAFKTTDGGKTWTKHTSSALTSLRSVFFRNNNLGWTVAADGKIAKTTDGGTTWVNKTSGVTTQLNVVYFTSDLIGFVFGAGGTIKKTTDGGETWSSVTSNVSDIASVQFLSTTLGYCAGASNSIAKTTDGGNTWTAQTSPSSSANYTDIFFANENVGFIYRDAATSSASVYKTTDGGATWTKPYITSPQIGATCLWFFSESNGLAFGRKGGICKTTDGAINWSKISSDKLNTVKDIFFLNENLGWVVAFDNSGSFYGKTTDGGITWNITSNTLFKPYAVYFINENYGWVSGDGGGVYKTTDGGNSWTGVIASSYGDHMYDVFFVDSLYGWAVGSDRTFLSTDGGTTWTLSLGGVQYAGGNKIYFMDRNRGFKDSYQKNYTTDGGITWQTNTTFTLQQASFAFANDKIGWAVGNNSVAKTTDGGITWINSNISGGYMVAAACSDTLNCWVVGGSGVLYRTTDGGSTWGRVPAHFSGDLNAIAVKGNNVWFGGANGSILSTIAVPTSIKDNNPITLNNQSYLLLQNYPNPFNPVTKINYQLSANSFVTLKVYDMLGKEVTTLVNGEQQFGTYSVNFDASHLSSGIYFYALKTGSFIQTKKMLLLK